MRRDLLPKDLGIYADMICEGGVPRRPVVYFLIHGGRVVYVGKATTNLFSRIGEHISVGKQFSRFVYIPVFLDRVREVEAAFIMLLRPPLNKSIPSQFCGEHDAYSVALSANLERVRPLYKMSCDGRCKRTLTTKDLPIELLGTIGIYGKAGDSLFERDSSGKLQVRRC